LRKVLKAPQCRCPADSGFQPGGTLPAGSAGLWFGRTMAGRAEGQGRTRASRNLGAAGTLLGRFCHRRRDEDGKAGLGTDFRGGRGRAGFQVGFVSPWSVCRTHPGPGRFPPAVPMRPALAGFDSGAEAERLMLAVSWMAKRKMADRRRRKQSACVGGGDTSDISMLDSALTWAGTQVESDGNDTLFSPHPCFRAPGSCRRRDFGGRGSGFPARKAPREESARSP
jgi:hypothetical protein